MVRAVSTRATPAGDQGQVDDDGLVVAVDPLVDDLPEQERVDDAHHRLDDHDDEEQRQDSTVGPGETEHPAGRALGDVLFGDRVVPAERAHDAAVTAHAPAASTPVESTHAHGRATFVVVPSTISIGPYSSPTGSGSLAGMAGLSPPSHAHR